MCTERLQTENSSCRSVFREKCNRCIIFPANAVLVADSIEKRNRGRSVRTKEASNLIIQIDETSFHLHKLPMASRSGYINRLVFQRTSTGEASSHIQINNLPGGYKIFELVVKFCYGLQVELTAPNIAPLYCSANFLEMSDDLDQENLISKTEPFLSYLIYNSWKDTIRILKSCETISSWANEMRIVKRCSESIAWKISIDSDEMQGFKFVENLFDSWWIKDILILRIDHFIEVIASCKKKGIRSELVGSCIVQWTTKWISQISLEFDNLTEKNLKLRLYKLTVKSLMMVLPEDEKSISCNFLLHLLKLGLILKVDFELLNKLEVRIAFMLEGCRAKDLLIKNYGYGDTLYGVEIVRKVVEAYVSLCSGKVSSRIHAAGRLIDEYLTLVARDVNLPAKIFQSLVETLPKSSRFCNDSLYKAIDTYLKAHPSLTEEERSDICRAMEYQKLSQEARNHALRNDRLPLNIITRFILLEQVNMTRSITAAGSNYVRTKSQTIMRVTKNLGREWMNSQKEIKAIKQDLETMKAQLCQLKTQSIVLRRQAKSCNKV